MDLWKPNSKEGGGKRMQIINNFISLMTFKLIARSVGIGYIHNKKNILVWPKEGSRKNKQSFSFNYGFLLGMFLRN
jgi:hypothetical protein